MKRRSSLYDSMLDYKKIKKIYNKVRVTTKNKKEVIRFSLNLNENLMDILTKLYKGKYVFNKYRIFLIREPKYRLIMSECIEDKIVNHLLSDELIKSLERCLIDNNVATRKNKGSKQAYNEFIKGINELMYKSKDIYVLKLDISKYFYNINHKVLMDMIKEKIKDKKALWLLKEILDTTDMSYVNRQIREVIYKEKERVKILNISKEEKMKLYKELDKISTYREGYGLPIGNMSSQILAVFFLNKVDHFFKEVLKCKNYIRYMDDLVIVDIDYDKLKEYKKIITKEIEKYDLKVNEKSSIVKLRSGVNFLGYNFKINKKLNIKYRKDTIKRVNKKIINLFLYNIDFLIKSFGSYKGYLSMCNTSIKNTLKGYIEFKENILFAKPIFFGQLRSAGVRAYARYLIIYSYMRTVRFFKLVGMLGFC